MTLFRIFAAAALFAVAACSGDTAGPAPVASVTLSPDTATIAPGETRAFTAVLKDASGNVLSGRPVQWRTNLPALATVDAEGRVTGRVEGLVDVYATSEGVTSPPGSIVVEIPIATLAIEFAQAQMTRGSSQVFRVVARDAEGRVLEDRFPSITSSAPGVVELRADYLFAIAPGTATLTARARGRTGTAVVTVVPRVASVAISPAEAATLAPGTTRQLTAQVKDADGAVLAGRTVSWSSSSPAVASVDAQGLVTAHAPGTTEVAATSEGVRSPSVRVTVHHPVTWLSIQPAGARLIQGEKRAYTVTARDAAGQVIPGLAVTVASSAPGVVAVRGDTLHALAPGAATVTATLGDRTAAADFVVLPVPTPVGGILHGGATWTRAGSPYQLTSAVQVPYGATLTIEPGVTVLGAGRALEVWGTLHAVGTAAQPIQFERTRLAGGSDLNRSFAIRVEHAVMDGGSMYAPSGAGSGSLVLRHSTLRDLESYLYVWYPTSDVFIEGNRFVRTGGISAGARANQARVYVRNNVFVDWMGGYAVENWASYGGDVMVVERNSFLGAGRTAVRLPRNYTDARMSARNNYWGTTDEAVIQSMIHDVNDDLTSAGAIEFRPYLTAPDPATPTP